MRGHGVLTEGAIGKPSLQPKRLEQKWIRTMMVMMMVVVMMMTVMATMMVKLGSGYTFGIRILDSDLSEHWDASPLRR